MHIVFEWSKRGKSTWPALFVLFAPLSLSRQEVKIEDALAADKADREGGEPEGGEKEEKRE